MDAETFDRLVDEALDSLPDWVVDALENVVVLVEDEPPAEDPELLGLYQGTPLTERDSGYTLALPDTVTIFRGPLLELCHTEAEVVEEVRITVVHEIAHHFGIDDERLHELGYD